ncbi:LysR substrate-binding domain-containing protein [Pseudomonas mosselii]|uniref:LysR family transcriptional regulator n=1 Tax=Pseudomonas mosselii TaxID=78327 RepID=UPI001BD60342|nr:LysR substrate-binding domain-containing protein [Pseudomonas mosselii]MBS9762330.1 LysR family transcriptional regulator [Pseudomonas mosselii]MDH1145357.1 LysR substrate-binding domain-containing protein [Pseudomonas mosselii]MDH1527348.1 LysR substrate-binding domain-containing protein [Pseudomonas mosselii]
MTSIRQLRYFVEIAEAGSFSAAAERLYIAQSALSRQIKELELHLGSALFERTARQPRLTAAGLAFLDRARHLLADLDKAERLAREVGQGLRGSLRLNHSSTVPLTGQLLQRLGTYLADNPGVSLEIAQQSSEAQLQDIAEGRLEIGLLRLPVLRQHEGVELHALFDEPLLLAVAASHPLATAGSVRLGQLREERFISIPHRQRGGLSYLSASLCMNEGFFPQAAQVVSRKTTQLQLIQAGFGVALLPLSMREIAPPSVTFVPLAEACQSTVALACRRDAGALSRKLLDSLRLPQGDQGM